jgi:cation diffusion facilitator family transporter
VTGLNENHFARRRSAALLSLGVGVALLVGKWLAYWLTGSHAILSDAMESVVHIGATGFAFVSIVLNARPPDPKYPYGYGKITYVSAGFEGGMIAVAALAILYEALQGLILGTSLSRLDQGLAIILAASMVNLALGLFLVRQGKRTRSLILEADGRHVLTDSYTSFGVVAGVALVRLTGWDWIDGAVAILAALNILWTGYHLLSEAIFGLMDRADPALLDRIVSALQAARRPGWIDLHHLRAWQAGDRTFVDFHLVVPETWTVGQVHEANDRCLAALRAALGGTAELIVHFDPDPTPRPPGFDPRQPWSVESAVRIPAPDDLGGEQELTIGDIVAATGPL